MTYKDWAFYTAGILEVIIDAGWDASDAAKIALDKFNNIEEPPVLPVPNELQELYNRIEKQVFERISRMVEKL